MPERHENGDFSENRRLILYRLDRLDEAVKELQDTLNDVRTDLNSLKYRAGAWGAIAGNLPALLAAIAYFLWKGHVP